MFKINTKFIATFLRVASLLFALSSQPIFAVSDEANVKVDVLGQSETPSTSGSGATLFNIYVEDVYIKPGLNLAEIYWDTTIPSLCTFLWGKTSEYKEETISEIEAKENHFVKLENLESSTVYHFKIMCEDDSNQTAQTSDQVFKTLTVLNNVSNFTATGDNKKVILKWTNPANENFDEVIILRSTNFFPLSVKDGAIIYSGSGNFYEDANLENDIIYFYTIFSVDIDKNYSSGALAFAVPHEFKSKPAPIDEIPLKPGIPVDGWEISMDDFVFFADEQKIAVEDCGVIDILQEATITISADCQKLDKAKSILIQLQGKEQTFSFILKTPEQKGFCRVSFLSPQKPGIYKLSILAVNEDNEVAGKVQTNLNILAKKYQWCIIELNKYLVGLLTVLVIIFFIIFFRKDKKSDKSFKENETPV